MSLYSILAVRNGDAAVIAQDVSACRCDLPQSSICIRRCAPGIGGEVRKGNARRWGAVVIGGHC
jgi:hypothetical protein